MAADPLATATRALVMVGISVVIGIVASFALAPDIAGQAVASVAVAAP